MFFGRLVKKASRKGRNRKNNRKRYLKSQDRQIDKDSEYFWTTDRKGKMDDDLIETDRQTETNIEVRIGNN